MFVRIRTRNACAFATARHTVAARKKMLHIDLCESGRIACCGQHVCAGTVLVTAYSTRIYPAHLREINAGTCACVSMRALCTCARVKGRMAGTYRDVQRCRSSSSRLGHSMHASRTHSASWPSRMACALLITTVGGALRHPNLCLEAGTTLYYTHMMRALSARTGSKRGRHLPAQNATSAFA